MILLIAFFLLFHTRREDRRRDATSRCASDVKKMSSETRALQPLIFRSLKIVEIAAVLESWEIIVCLLDVLP